MEDKGYKLTENGIEKIESEEKESIKDIFNKITDNPIQKEIITKEIPKEIPKEIKKEKIKEFSKDIESNPITKGHTLINKASLIGLWITIGILVLFLFIQIIWSNANGSSFNQIFKDKNFADTINLEPNISIEDTNNFNPNYTINVYNNLTLPEEIAIKLINSS